jgi:hypothetical protein
MVLSLLVATAARADNLYGSIRGTVTDPSGAALVGATVTATNTDTGIATKVTSSEAGVYVFPQLPTGSYKVTITAANFKTFQAAGIHLDLNEVYTLNAKMELGAASVTVEVLANAVQVESTDMQLGTTVTGNQIVDLPLNGRNWTQLQQLQPGVVASSDRFGTYSTNGAETQQNAFLINGIDTNEAALNTPGFIPSPDSISEFRMVTSTLNPEFGRNSGAILNAAIKSGSNKFHGDAFEFYRDTFLDAKSWFELQASTFHQNQFGGTIGGPIVKDRAFFFFSYQGTRASEPEGTGDTPVYTQPERGGLSGTGNFDFSAVASSFNDAVLITNPTTGLVTSVTNPNVSPFALTGDSASPCAGTPCPAGTSYGIFYNAATCVGQLPTSPGCAPAGNGLFSTGVIPAQDANALAVKLVNQFVPPANSGNDYLFSETEQAKANQYIYRIDDKLSKNDELWFVGAWQSNPTNEPIPFTGATLPGFPETSQLHRGQYTVSWTHTFTPTTLNEVRFGFFRFNFQAVEPVNPINPTSYGFTGITPQVASVASLPVMNVTGFFSLGFSSNGPQPRIDNTYQFADNFSKVLGKHTLKAGATIERIEVNNPFYNNLSGTFSYSGVGIFSSANAGADFLLGIPDSYIQGSGSVVYGRGGEYYSYFQDQWKVKPSLTLTLGTGWDLEIPYHSLYAGGLINAAFRPGQQSTVFPTAPVGLVYPGDAGINKYGGIGIHYKDIAPRLGFAWNPWGSAKWSVRGGVGLYYNRTEEELALQGLTNPPFAITSTGASTATGLSSPGFATPFTTVNPAAVGSYPSGTLANPFPFSPPAPGSSPNFAPFEPIGYGLNTVDPHFGAPRSTNFNLTIEHQLSPSTIVSLGYVGNLGRHLEGAIDLNQPNGGNGAAAVAAGCTSPFALPFCDPQGFPLSPLVYGGPGDQVTFFSSNYNSLQAEFNRRFSNGLQVQASYTWSRYFDYTSSLENSAFNAPGINPFNVKSMYAPSANDAPQRFVVNYTYVLPFYRLGHHWKRLTDDWTLAGIYTLQHGFPVNVWSSAWQSLTCDIAIVFYACPDRADRTGSPLVFGNPRNNTINGNPNMWFNPAAFAVPALGNIGSASRNPFYGPGINYSDLALYKDVHINEAMYFQVRLETFNTFNHAQFASPVNDVNNPLFGEILGVQAGTTNGDGRVLQLGAKFYF